MTEYLKAIYAVEMANNKFLVALEKRIMRIEEALLCELPAPEGKPEESDT